MAEIVLVLGQLVADGSQQLLYTSPALTRTVVATVNFANNDASDVKAIGLWVVPNGETLAAKHLVVPDGLTLQPKQPWLYQAGISLAPGDRIYIRGADSNIVASAWGAQVT